MFSSMIQNMLNSSSKQAAEARLAQIQNYSKSFNLRPTQVDAAKAANTKSFQDVMKASTKSEFGSLLTPNVKNPNNTSPVLNVSSNILPSSSYAKPNRAQLMGMISKISNKYGVDEKLVKSVIKQESGFNVDAKSKAGAMGLMQLMPQTAKSLGVTDIKNPVQNVDGGVRYLKSMLQKYNGNIILALAAYNAGPSAVDKFDGVPPYKETQNYVKSILANYLS